MKYGYLREKLKPSGLITSQWVNNINELDEKLSNNR